MLILKRSADERIVINNGEIEIVVISVRGDNVRLGISAPRNTPIHRGEVQARIDAIKDDRDATEGSV